MSVNVKLEGDGINFSFTTNIRKAGQIITFLGSEEVDEQIVSQREVVTTELLPVSIKNKTPRQVLVESRAKTNPQKLVVLGYYYCELNNVATFPLEELKGLFGKIGEPVPKNLHRDLRIAVKDSHIYEQNPGEYLITDSAKDLIKKGFSDIKSTRRPASRATNKTGITQKIVADEIKGLEISNTLEGFPGYWDLGQKGERILWLFVFAEKKGIHQLGTADVEYMADQLRDNIPTRSFTALTETIFKRSYISKSGEKYRVLQPGIDYLVSKVKVN